MKKLLLAVFLTLGLTGMAHAVCDHRTTTCMTALDVSGAFSAGSVANAGASSVGGVLTLSASTPYAIKISSKTAAIPAGTPTAAGLIAFDSTYVMYVSTGTGPAAWVKVGGQ